MAHRSPGTAPAVLAPLDELRERNSAKTELLVGHSSALELAERSIARLAPQHRWPQPEDDAEPGTTNTKIDSKSKVDTSSTMHEHADDSFDLAEAWGLRARAILALLRSGGQAEGRAARKRRDRYLHAALDSLAYTLRIQKRVLLRNADRDADADGDIDEASTHSHPKVAETQVNARVEMRTTMSIGLRLKLRSRFSSTTFWRLF